MDGCGFCALTESYLNSPPLANVTEEGRRFTNVAQRWAITASRPTNCPGAWSNATLIADGHDGADR